METQTKLSKQTVFLHWTVGISMIVLLASGIIMDEFELYSLYDWHKSFGVAIVLFVMWRILWRMWEGWPQHDHSLIEIKLAKIVHWTLIAGTVLMPISGVMMSGFGGYGVPLFGWELIERNPNPMNLSEVVPINEFLSEVGDELHDLGKSILIFAIGLHVLGALKHHIIDKDNTLKRMLGK